MYTVRTRDEHLLSDGVPNPSSLWRRGLEDGHAGHFSANRDNSARAHGPAESFRLEPLFRFDPALYRIDYRRGAGARRTVRDHKNISTWSKGFQKAGFVRVRRAFYDKPDSSKSLKSIRRRNTMGRASGDGLLIVTKRLDSGSTLPISNNPRENTLVFVRMPTSSPIPPIRSAGSAGTTAAPRYFAPKGRDHRGKPGEKGLRAILSTAA